MLMQSATMVFVFFKGRRGWKCKFEIFGNEESKREDSFYRGQPWGTLCTEERESDRDKYSDV